MWITWQDRCPPTEGVTVPSQIAQLPERIGPYKIRALLGEGGMGVVYQGVSPAGETVAVKQIRGVVLSDHDKARFHSEIEALKIVYGARVAPFIAGDSAPTDEDPWLAVKYIPGDTLWEYVDTDGPLEPVLVGIMGAALAEGLQSIHEANLLHRDLKPRNIILGHDGPFVIDFGLALLTETKVRRAEEPGRLTAPGDTVGTLVCMPPEQVRGELLSAAADVYALGATLLYAATGNYPYETPNQFALSVQINSPSVAPNVTSLPPALQPPITAMLAMTPSDRPSLGEVTATLVQIVNAAGFDAQRARTLLRHTTARTTPREAEPVTASASESHQQAGSIPRPAREPLSSNTPSPRGALRAARKLRVAYGRDAAL
jgi:serine/threonine protein kinase